MALYMLMGRYTTKAIKDIISNGSDREAAAAAAIEAAGGKLVGFYGMFGQEYNVAIIAEVPGNAEYIGAVAPAIGSGVFEAYKTIPLYTAKEVVKASKIAKRVAKAYTPPGG
jgi:uncharacterized protein with GYD domain